MTISDLSEHERQDLRKESVYRDRQAKLGLPIPAHHSDRALAHKFALSIAEVREFIDNRRKRQDVHLDAEAAAGEAGDGT